MKYTVTFEDDIKLKARVRYDVEYDSETNQVQIVSDSIVKAPETLSVYDTVRGFDNLDHLDFMGVLFRIPEPRQLLIQSEIDTSSETVLEVGPQGPAFRVGGISSTNNLMEVVVHSILIEDIERLSGPVDPNFWNVVGRFSPFEGGMISNLKPAMIRISTFGKQEKPPVLEMAFWGL